MEKDKPIILLYPPPSDPTQPYSSLPALTSFLRHHEHTVVQRDLGIELLDELLSPRNLAEACQSATERARGTSSPSKRDYLERFYELIGISEYIIGNIDEAKHVMRDGNEFYNMKRYQWAAGLIKLACDIVSLPYHPTILGPCYYLTNYEPTFKGLQEAIMRKTDNVFFDIFNQKIIPQILEMEPLLVGVSVTYENQIIPAFTLSRLLKLNAPDVHISFGGAIIQHMEKALLNDPMCFLYADSFCTGEGETALLTLARNLSSREEPRPVPNMIMKTDGRPNAYNLRHYEDVNSLPCPDFEGLKLERYLSPEPVLLLPSARGCYYGKCAFCDVSKNTRRIHRKIKKEHISANIQELYQRYGARRFFFCDDAMPPGNMRYVSKLVSETLHDVTWGAEARFERIFTQDFVSTLKIGGCRFLLFGLESASQRVLNAMNKGNSVENDTAVVKSCSENGIYVNLQTFIGFPTETSAEARETINFIINNERSIACFGLGPFTLESDTPIYREPHQYGISSISAHNSVFGDFLSYVPLIGMTMEDTKRELKLALEKLSPIFANRTKFLASVSGGHSLLYHSHFGYDEIYQMWKEMDIPEWEDVLDIDDLVLGISPTLLFSHPPIEMCSFRHMAFCSNTGEQFLLLPDEHRLLELCDGKRTVGESVSIWISDQTEEFDAQILLLARGLAIIRDYLRKGLVRPMHCG